MARYKLLVGKHVQDAPSGEGSATYSPGDVFDNDKTELLTLNAPGMSPKFEKVSDSTALRPRVAPKLNSLPAKGKESTTTVDPKRPTAPAQVIPPEAEGDPSSVDRTRVPGGTLEGPDETDGEDSEDGGEDTYDSMTVAELRAHAAEEGIGLHGATTKADILKVLKKAK